MEKHFVLVHGAGPGAWCWFKLVHELKSAGHKVTALDLGNSGINPKQLDDCATIDVLVQPLLEFLAYLPQDEKIILVGHSFGGFSISFTMERFPEKIMVAVYVSAYMPNHVTPPASLLDELFRRKGDSFLDCKFTKVDRPEGERTFITFGPLFLAMMYKYCPPEDLELAKMLVRSQWLFSEDLLKESILTECKFGSVDRIYVTSGGDSIMDLEFQQWIIDNSPPKEVKFINEAGYMAMLSRPKQLSQCLREIAENYR